MRRCMHACVLLFDGYTGAWNQSLTPTPPVDVQVEPSKSRSATDHRCCFHPHRIPCICKWAGRMGSSFQVAEGTVLVALSAFRRNREGPAPICFRSIHFTVVAPTNCSSVPSLGCGRKPENSSLWLIPICQRPLI